MLNCTPMFECKNGKEKGKRRERTLSFGSRVAKRILFRRVLCKLSRSCDCILMHGRSFIDGKLMANRERRKIIIFFILITQEPDLNNFFFLIQRKSEIYFLNSFLNSKKI